MIFTKTTSFFKHFIFFVLCFVFSSFNFFALEVPALTGRVVDNAGIILAEDKNEINSYLENLEKSTGIQVAVLTIKTLKDESLEDFSLKVAEKWGLGKKDKDNGVLLLVSLEERKARIETGYGLEGTLTDTKCGLILRNVMFPSFRNGNYSKGILEGIKNISGLFLNDESLVSENVLNEDTEDSSAGMSILFGLFWVFGWFVLFSCIASGKKNHFLPWVIFTSAYQASHKSSHSTDWGNNFSSGHSSFGGSHGGGFSGGGGHFGGGGASGRW